jgi:hypothetical protein
MRFSSNNLGLALAVLAGIATLGVAIWPGSAPQAESLSFWLPLAVASGCGFLLAAIVSDRSPAVSRVLLIVGGVALVCSGLYFGLIAGGGGRSALAVTADVLPGILALAAGLTIGRVERGAIP